MSHQSDEHLESAHVPVMVEEVVRFLDPREGQRIVDGTVGGGGHAHILAKALGESGQLIGLDHDPMMLSWARRRVDHRNARFFENNFAQIRDVLDDMSIDRVDGILLDLGVSSDQLERAERGFSFSRPGPLDMRMSPLTQKSAADLVNQLHHETLANIFFEYGEERHSRRVAKAIAGRRAEQPFETTDDLAEVVRRTLPRNRTRIDPATRVFQALRIAVNLELEMLKTVLHVLPDCLKPGGRAVIISFHSLEDRLVKRSFQKRDEWMRITKKPVRPRPEEIQRNPRCRSALLRAASLMTGE